MSFGGSVQAMVTSLKNNARQRNTIFDKLDGNTNTENSESWNNIIEQKATPEQLEEVREKIISENKNKLYKNVLALIITMVIIAVFFTLFYFFTS